MTFNVLEGAPAGTYLGGMARTLPDKSPYKMDVPSRRDLLSGEALRWYDRAARLEGRALNIRPNERTAFQKGLDEVWRAVSALHEGTDVDSERLERLYARMLEQWSAELGDTPPAPDWPVQSDR